MLFKKLVKQKLIILLTTFFGFFSPDISFAQEYGLQFQGDKYTLDDRTSLNITPSNYLKATKEFEISFDIKLNAEEGQSLFGYIFRVISKKENNIDLIVSSFQGNKFSLIVGGEETEIGIERNETLDGKWLPFTIRFLVDENKITIGFNGKTTTTRAKGLSENQFFKIFFGANNYKGFANSDVPNIAIRDLYLKKGSTVLAKFPLNQCGGTTAKDELGNRFAELKNPDWILCQHQTWKEELTSKVEGIQLAAFDSANEKFYLLNEKSLLTYTPRTKKIDKVPFLADSLQISLSHRLVYNAKEQRLYCYLTDTNDFAYFDEKAKTWSNPTVFSGVKHFEDFQQHASAYDKLTNTLYVIGGYGRYKYSNKIKSLNFETGQWKETNLTTESFRPRYLVGATAYQNKIYVYGGYGSDTGNQLINPQSYFDLLVFDPSANSITKLHETNHLLEDMSVSNSIIINPENKDFYALIWDKTVYENSMKLLKGNISSETVAFVGNTIPFKFLDTRSTSNLFLSAKNQKLFAYTSLLNEERNTEFAIHSIAAPPIPVNITTNEELLPSSGNMVSYVLLGLTVVLLILVFLFLRKRNIRKKTTQYQVVNATEEIKIENKLNTIPEEKNTVATGGKVLSKLENSTLTSKREYQIIFFGGFQVIDSEGNDITGKFSPLLKELFLLMWLYTFRNDKGISSEKLTEMLWYDKPPRKAQNNRSVNITKLRGLLKKVGGLEISKDTGYWKIAHQPEVLKTDYYDVLLITSVKKKDITKKHINRLVKITRKGTFLLNLNYEWLESFRQDIADKIIYRLINFAESFNIKSDPDFALQLSECILHIDPINEDAIIYKCKAYNYKGNHSLSKATFENFQKEYEALYNEPFYMSFTEMLEKEN